MEKKRLVVELSPGAAKLRRILPRRGIAACARAVGVSRQAVREWRDGRSTPEAARRELLLIWSRALGDAIEPHEWDRPARERHEAAT